MTALEGRIVRLELMNQRLQMQLQTLGAQVTALQSQSRQGAVVTTPGGGSGGGGGAFWCINPGIVGGGSGIADVYTISGGSNVLVAAGATIWNPYLSPTTASRVCTLCRNNDGTYQIYGQSCT